MLMDIYEHILEICLDHGFTFYSSLPCSYNTTMLEKLNQLNGTRIKSVSKELIHIPLVREESGVALNAGAYLGGRKTAMVLQNQGLGNMVTQMLSLNSDLEGSYNIPNLLIISHRGQEGEKINAQKPVGNKTREILDLVGVQYIDIKYRADLDKIPNLLRKYEKNQSIALLVRPEYEDSPYRLKSTEQSERTLKGTRITESEQITTMSRHQAIETVMKHVKDEFIISNLGHPSRELFDIKDRKRNFYLTSCLGQSYMLSLGFSLTMRNAPEKIIAFEGDGGILMNSGSLSILAHQLPKNLILMILDNGVYGSTGNIKTYTSQSVNLSGLAQAYGFPESKIYIIADLKDLDTYSENALRKDGPFLFHILLNDEYRPVPILPYSVIEIKNRFMNEISNL